MPDLEQVIRFSTGNNEIRIGKNEQKQWNLWVGKDVKAVGGLAQKIERKKEICHRTSSRNHKT